MTKKDADIGVIRNSNVSYCLGNDWTEQALIDKGLLTEQGLLKYKIYQLVEYDKDLHD